jgi:hypothetical protein
VLVVANCAFCQTDQPSTVPCPVKINDLQHERIGKIERDITAFEVAPQLSEHTAEDAVLALENLLKQAVSIRDLALQQEAALAELEDKIAACEQSGRDVQDVIARFQTLALVDSLDALRTAIAQSERLRALQSENDKVSASLFDEGDGLTLDALSEECADPNLDELAAREQTLDRHIAELRARLLEAGEIRSEARRAFEAMGGADQAALAEMSAIATDYVRVRSACLLLQSSIERFRREPNWHRRPKSCFSRTTRTHLR